MLFKRRDCKLMAGQVCLFWSVGVKSSQRVVLDVMGIAADGWMDWNGTFNLERHDEPN